MCLESVNDTTMDVNFDLVNRHFLRTCANYRTSTFVRYDLLLRLKTEQFVKKNCT